MTYGFVRVSYGDLLPRFYGVAWWDWNRRTAAVAVIPLNLILALGRRVWIFLKHGLAPAGMDREILGWCRQAYADGRREARPEEPPTSYYLGPMLPRQKRGPRT